MFVIKVFHTFLILLNTPLCDKIDITVGTKMLPSKNLIIWHVYGMWTFCNKTKIFLG